MTRLALSIVTSLLVYFAYQALATEAMSTQGGGPKSPSTSSETSDNMITDFNGLSKLQNAWFKSGQPFNRRISSANAPRVGTFNVFRRTSLGANGGPSTLNSGSSGLRIPGPASYPLDSSNPIDNDEEDFVKRFDDYGHMRFGKRGGEGDQFDDYGHMRFGR